MSIAKQLLKDARNSIIDKDALLKSCLNRLESLSEDDLYTLALKEGFIKVDDELQEERELHKLSASQRIIEKVLRRYGE